LARVSDDLLLAAQSDDRHGSAPVPAAVLAMPGLICPKRHIIRGALAQNGQH
jgi:hypothetical protein